LVLGTIQAFGILKLGKFIDKQYYFTNLEYSIRRLINLAHKFNAADSMREFGEEFSEIIFVFERHR
jgi:hypothetical protein